MGLGVQGSRGLGRGLRVNLKRPRLTVRLVESSQGPLKVHPKP